MFQADINSVLQLSLTKRYIDTSSAALLLWDHMLTFNNEIRLIWRSPWSMIKMLYILNKVLALSYILGTLVSEFRPILSDHHCKIVTSVYTWVHAITHLIAQIILFIRTCAIWANATWVKVLLATVYVGCAIPIFYVLAVSVKAFQFEPPGDYGQPGCLIAKSSPILDLGLIFIFIFDTVVLILTTIKAWPYYKNEVRDSLRTDIKQSVQYVLYRDGFVFYLYLLALTIVNTVYTVKVLNKAPDTLILLSFQLALDTVFSSRVVLNLRRTHLKEATRSNVMIDLIPLHAVQFAPNHLQAGEGSNSSLDM